VFSRGKVGEVTKGDGEGPPTKLFGEGPLGKSCFDGDDVDEVTEDGGKASHVKVSEKAMAM
jgi:hypothetical protein